MALFIVLLNTLLITLLIAQHIAHHIACCIPPHIAHYILFHTFQHKLAKMLIGYGFSLASLSDCGGSADLDKQQCLVLGEEKVDEAMNILKEVK